MQYGLLLTRPIPHPDQKTGQVTSLNVLDVSKWDPEWTTYGVILKGEERDVLVKWESVREATRPSTRKAAAADNPRDKR